MMGARVNTLSRKLLILEYRNLPQQLLFDWLGVFGGEDAVAEDHSNYSGA
jgi:hypothetical protein